MSVRDAIQTLLLEIAACREYGLVVPPPIILRAEHLRTALHEADTVEVPREPTTGMVCAAVGPITSQQARDAYAAFIASAEQTADQEGGRC